MFNFFVRATALREQFCKEEFGDLKIKVLTQIVSAVFMRGSEEIKFFTIYLPISEIPSEHFSLHKVSKEILGNLGSNRFLPNRRNWQKYSLPLFHNRLYLCGI